MEEANFIKIYVFEDIVYKMRCRIP